MNVMIPFVELLYTLGIGKYSSRLNVITFLNDRPSSLCYLTSSL